LQNDGFILTRLRGDATIFNCNFDDCCDMNQNGIICGIAVSLINFLEPIKIYMQIVCDLSGTL
jgi:hypothetical protein